MKTNLSLLKTLPLFESIEEDKIINIINCLDGYEKAYEKNQIIYNFLDKIEYGGIVLEGEVSMVMINFCGNEYGVRHFKKGDLFGDSYACAPFERSKVQVLAQEKSKILFLKFSNLFLTKSTHCSYASQVTVNLLKEITKSNILQNNKIQILIQKHIRDKLIVYLCSLGLKDKNIITLPFNRQELADHLGVDRSALSRELGKMKKDGLIDFNKNKLYILKNSFLYTD